MPHLALGSLQVFVGLFAPFALLFLSVGLGGCADGGSDADGAEKTGQAADAGETDEPWCFHCNHVGDLDEAAWRDAKDAEVAACLLYLNDHFCSSTCAEAYWCDSSEQALTKCNRGPIDTHCDARPIEKLYAKVEMWNCLASHFECTDGVLDNDTPCVVVEESSHDSSGHCPEE